MCTVENPTFRFFLLTSLYILTFSVLASCLSPASTANRPRTRNCPFILLLYDGLDLNARRLRGNKLRDRRDERCYNRSGSCSRELSFSLGRVRVNLDYTYRLLE